MSEQTARQYILLIHGNAASQASTEEWQRFFELAKASGTFRGGSAIGARTALGRVDGVAATDHVVGFMRFDADDEVTLRALLAQHPVVVHGGTVELCEMPRD